MRSTLSSVDLRRQLLQGVRLEKRCDGEFLSKLLLDLEEQLHGQQGVPAEIKEVVLPAHAFDTECSRPNGCQGGFHRRPRRLEVAAQKRAILFRRRQSLAVNL